MCYSVSLRTMAKKTAQLISDIVNPFSVSLAMIIVLSFHTSASPAEALKWMLLSISFSIFPVLAVLLYLVHKERLDAIFVRARRQRNKVYVLAIFCAALSVGILFLLDAPELLLASYASAIIALTVYMCINLWWKISVHTGFVSASLILTVILYGLPGLWALPLLPLIGWSRVELAHHSTAQVIVGAALSPLTVMATFYCFGLLA